MADVFRLAHVTDPHFRGWAGLGLGDLAGKRVVGLLNLAVNRGRRHKMDLLEALRIDVRVQHPDHLALTGDLSNVALAGEWRAALAWLDMSGVAPDAISVIPGNHDAYLETVVKARTFEQLFAPYQTSDLPRAEGTDYPFVQLRDDVALIGVTSCVATGDLGAWGLIGEPQLARLEALLTAPELADMTRVVLLHHPPIKHKGTEHRNLRDRDAFAAVLARTGADLVLHGHDHQDERAELSGPGGKSIPVIGGGSASYAGSAERRCRYNIFELGAAGITWITRAHDEATDSFREVRRERLG
jgi:3',5'-cyclic AMP phosphodiesterase CpdA